MTFLLCYLAIGCLAAWIFHATGKIDRIMQDSIAEGISDDVNFVIIGVAIGTLFLWPLMLASYLANRISDLLN